MSSFVGVSKFVAYLAYLACYVRIQGNETSLPMRPIRKRDLRQARFTPSEIYAKRDLRPTATALPPPIPAAVVSSAVAADAKPADAVATTPLVAAPVPAAPATAAVVASSAVAAAVKRTTAVATTLCKRFPQKS